MATALSDIFRRMAVSMVERFGKDGYFIRRRFPGEKDPKRPTRPADVVVKDFPCKAAITAYTVNQIDFVQVLRGDMQAVLAYTPNLPDDIVPGDQFLDGNIVYNIIPPHERITVNGELVCYMLQLRR